jgi:small subunit ribosomal protein S20
MASRCRSSRKSMRGDKKRHIKNLKIKNTLKKTIKKFQELLAAKKTLEAKAALQKIFSQFDKAAKKRIIHPNTANRKKSRLARRLSRAT